MQKLIIKNFGPLKDIELDIQDFMVFIGPQATGKSTIAKLVYFFKEIKKDIKELVRVPKMKWEAAFMIETLEKKIIPARFQAFFGQKSSYYRSNSEITFQYKSQFCLKISFQNSKPIVSLSQNQRIPLTIQAILKNLAAGGYKIAEKRIKMVNQFLEKMELTENNHLIPAGRGTIANGTSFYFERTDETIRDFLFLMETIKYSLSMEAPFAERTEIDLSILSSLMTKMLKGEYVVKDEEEYIFYNKISKVPIHSASSGQQEASRLLIILMYLLVEYETNFTIIEEPEAHIYPIGQNQMAQAMAFCFNHNNKMLITTHSPYILSAINNLLFAHQCANKFTKAKTALNKIIPQACWLNLQKVAVYYVDEGKIKSIIDEKTGLIGINELDGASEVIMQDFEAIMEIYRKENRKK